MMQLEWHNPSRQLVPLHLEEAMERSQFGLAGLLFSAAMGLATLGGVAVGIVTPAPAREAPGLLAHQQPVEECSVAELACVYGVDISGTAESVSR
ncbi:hypothetical protein [Desertibaculum subflavum]|uniref:hypothetical protein n=1 Tax=Desertibaculum subflavum TaxID=2268458 RepID=UPI000E66142A